MKSLAPTDGVRTECAAPPISPAPSKNRDSTFVGTVMARVADASNNWLVRAIAVGAVAILVGVVSWTLVTVLNNSNENARQIAAMNARMERMEQDIQRLINGQ